MSHFKAFVLSFVVAACGRQLVEFKRPVGVDAPPVKAPDGNGSPDVSGPPAVTVVDPSNGASSVALDKSIRVAFNRLMDCATINSTTFTVKQGATPITGTLACSGASATLTPTSPLAASTSYSATVTTAVTDVAGLALAADYQWSFSTLDTTAPLIIFIDPSDGATGVCPNISLQVSFNDAMDPATLNSATFTLTSSLMSVGGAVSYDAAQHSAHFTPATPLAVSTAYVATVTTGVKNQRGVALAHNEVWRFTTGATDCQAPVNLRSLSTFVAVAGAGLTNSNSAGSTTLNGDVGLSPTATCLGDGVPCTALDPVINGTLYAADPAGVAAQAKADLTDAYNDAAGRPPGIVTNALAGLILPPGVYSSGSTMSIAVGGVLVLDAQGDSNAVWIFQVGSALTVNNNAQVLLINGAKAGNVFWAVFAASTLGSNVSFKGNVLAGSSNSVGTNSVVEGRLLCRTGQITLLADTITLPAP